jgi:hypothetical protein
VDSTHTYVNSYDNSNIYNSLFHFLKAICDTLQACRAVTASPLCHWIGNFLVLNHPFTSLYMCESIKGTNPKF